MSILSLPNETLSQILLLLPVSSIINCAKACKHIKQVVYQDHIWKALCEIIHGVDTINQKQYNGQWRQVFIEGKAPWINLQNKRYIRKNIEKAEKLGQCIEYNISHEDLVINWTTHYSSSYSPSRTHAVGIMDTHNFQVKKIEGFEDLHFKKAGNYLLAFQMDQFSCIYPQGISTNDVLVFKYDPNNLPKSVNEAQYKISTRSVQYAQEPRMLFNSKHPELIYYASTLAAPSARTENGPFIVDIFDLKTNAAKPIKKQKLLGDAYAFNGNYVVLTKSGKPEGKIYLANWNDFTTENEYDKLFDFDGQNVKVLQHKSEVQRVFITNDGLIACSEKSGHVTIWSTEENTPKVVKTINTNKFTNTLVSVTHFDEKLLFLSFNPNGGEKIRNSCMIIDWQNEKEITTISPLTLYFTVEPVFTKHGNFSGKMVLMMRGRTDVLYTSTPYLAKKFDVAVLTSSGDKIIAKRARTIFGHLAEDCKNLIGLSNAAALTSQVLLDNGARRYVLLFEEDVLTREEIESNASKPSVTPLTALLHLSVLSHHDHSPYGGLEFSGLDADYQNPSMRRATQVSLKKLRINGTCLLMKEEVSEEFGGVPVDLEHNLEQLMGDIERDMRTLYNAYHGFI